MAPVETQVEVSLLPLAAAGLHLFAALWLTGLVSRTVIFRSYLALPPSQATRRREEARRRHVRLFAALAALSLLSAAYWRCCSAALSYGVWAAERGVLLPERIFGDGGALGGGDRPRRLHLARWLSDTPIYRDALEIVAERAGRAWWGEQLDLTTVSWGMLLAIEGRRRKIPHLWAFMSLANLVGLSFAQNLFYVALLLTPLPLPDNVKELTKSSLTGTSSTYANFVDKTLLSKPDNWCPHPILSLIPLIASFMTVFLLSFAANTPSFMILALAFRVLSFAPLVLPYVAPESWGTIHVHPHNAYSAYTALFRTISVLSFLLHGKATVLALLFNTPDSHYHRHSILHPFKQEHRSIIERSSTAVSKVLGAIGDHPAVSVVGWDVLLSGMSLGLWAANRGLDVSAILSSSALSFGGKSEATLNTTPDSKSIVGKLEETAEKSIEKLEPTKTPGKRRPGRPKKSEYANSEDGSTSSVARRRGRPRKGSISDSTYHPAQTIHEEGEEDEDEDWEAAALTWGLIAVAGMGTGSSGVFGAETTAR